MTVDKRIFILIGIIVILVTVLLVTLFKGSRTNDLKYMELLIAEKDSVIASVKRERATLEAEIIEREISFEALETLDSVTYSHYRTQQAIYKLLNDKISNISKRVSSVSNNNDSLRRILSEF